MKTVLCYGDSNTWGLDASGTTETIQARHSRYERWPGVLQQTLGSQYYVIEEGLNGRTTVWDDPIEGHKSGKTYLAPCLESHKPLDLVIIMLGTNDLKKRFSLSAFDIAAGVETLVHMIQTSGTGPDGSMPQTMILAPAPIGKFNDKFSQMFEGAEEKAPKLAIHYQRVADQYGCAFLDTATFLIPDSVDGLHLAASEHRKLGERVAQLVNSLFD